jgi:hypothetical protein
MSERIPLKIEINPMSDFERAEKAERELAALQLTISSTWRCFHCGFETTDEKLAAAHFGARDDAEEFKPLCKWWASMSPEERGEALQDVILQLNQERADNESLTQQISSVRSVVEESYREQTERHAQDLQRLRLELDIARQALEEIARGEFGVFGSVYRSKRALNVMGIIYMIALDTRAIIY